jgi:hypothetical protein
MFLKWDQRKGKYLRKSNIDDNRYDNNKTQELKQPGLNFLI